MRYNLPPEGRRQDVGGRKVGPDAKMAGVTVSILCSQVVDAEVGVVIPLEI